MSPPTLEFHAPGTRGEQRISPPTLEFHAAGKRYGRDEAVAEVSLTVAPGECLALVGHNGAGKTTLFKLALGLTRPTAGTIRVLGEEPARSAAVRARRGVGFLPENVTFHDTMTGREVLGFFARLKGEPVGESLTLLDLVGLAGVADKRIGTYSKGMRQRLGLAQALLGAPRLLLLDEPTAGLDPLLRRSFYAIVQGLAAAGTTVVLSSHALTELEARTDRVAIMNGGYLVACGTLAELREAARLPLRIRFAAPAEEAPAIAARLAGQASSIQRPPRASGRWVELTCGVDDKMELVRRIVALGARIEDIDIVPPSLDDVYAHFGEATTAADGRPES